MEIAIILLLFPIIMIGIGVLLFAYIYLPLSLSFILPSLLVLSITGLIYVGYNFVIDKVKTILRK